MIRSFRGLSESVEKILFAGGIEIKKLDVVKIQHTRIALEAVKAYRFYLGTRRALTVSVMIIAYRNQRVIYEYLYLKGKYENEV